MALRRRRVRRLVSADDSAAGVGTDRRVRGLKINLKKHVFAIHYFLFLFSKTSLPTGEKKPVEFAHQVARVKARHRFGAAALLFLRRRNCEHETMIKAEISIWHCIFKRNLERVNCANSF